VSDGRREAIAAADLKKEEGVRERDFGTTA
jgi:hypothetical protein